MSTSPQTTRDRGDELRSEAQSDLWRMAGPWWVLLLTGIAWLIISVIVLRFTTTSAATIGVLLGWSSWRRWQTSSLSLTCGFAGGGRTC